MGYGDYEISPVMLSILTDGEMDETDAHLMVSSVDEINDIQEEELWFIIGSSKSIVELFGCPSKSGLLKLAYETGTFNFTYPDKILQATIYSPCELPCVILDDLSVVVIFGDHSIEIFTSIQKAIKYIEETMEKYDQSDITDFAVLIGKLTELDTEEWNDLILNNGVTENECFR